jgi:hypothetical protein
MPRYFFNLHAPGIEVPDPVGEELVDADAAFTAATRIARGLMAVKLDLGLNWLAARLDVTDEEGDTVFELPFVEVVDFGREAH